MSKLRKIAIYRHSKHFKKGMPAIVGPRTYTNSSRRWQVRLIVDLPIVPGDETRQFVNVTINTPAMRYGAAAEFAIEELKKALKENPTATDFAWEVWA
jgi:hypothetical protein